MNCIWIAALAGILIFGLKYFLNYLFYSWHLEPLYVKAIQYILIAIIMVLTWNFFGHGLRRIRFWNSDYLNTSGGILLLVLVLLGGLLLTRSAHLLDLKAFFSMLGFEGQFLPNTARPPDSTGAKGLVISLITLGLTGFFANPTS
jgi:hypothetical protein